jgi:hypothetical protein
MGPIMPPGTAMVLTFGPIGLVFAGCVVVLLFGFMCGVTLRWEFGENFLLNLICAAGLVFMMEWQMSGNRNTAALAAVLMSTLAVGLQLGGRLARNDDRYFDDDRYDDDVY